MIINFSLHYNLDPDSFVFLTKITHHCIIDLFLHFINQKKIHETVLHYLIHRLTIPKQRTSKVLAITQNEKNKEYKMTIKNRMIVEFAKFRRKILLTN